MITSRSLFDDCFAAEATEHWLRLKEIVSLGRPVTGRVIAQYPFGVFLDLGVGFLGLLEVHEFEEANRIRGAERFPEVGSDVPARVLQFVEGNRQIRLTQGNASAEQWRQLKQSLDQFERGGLTNSSR